jgi:hypothetical protein
VSPILLEPRPVSEAKARGGTSVEGRDFIVTQRALRCVTSGEVDGDDHSPTVRPLRIFTIDPTAACDDGAIATVDVPFEALKPGPAGGRIEVFDDSIVDGRVVEPLDLDDRGVLLRQGRDPSVTDAQFRAQMAYTVCSAVIETFGRALGRHVPWAFSGPGPDAARLRVRCHADGLHNAYYDPSAGELTFGAFDIPPSATVRGLNVPGGRVCTALLHDVLAHETTHALLDGLRARSLCPSNPDVPAFHEAFSDLVALLQRFSYPAVVRAGLRQSRGDVLGSTLLTRFGEQFAQTNDLGDELRSASKPKARDGYKRELEPHARGEVLLAAVFRAFCNIARKKTRSTVRLATGGTSIFPPGELPDPVVDLLTKQIVDLARQFQAICIRAIDYCPPVDITFGEYLRAVITADAELVPDDPWGYRDAWVEAFLYYGVYPSGVVSLSEDALRWRGPQVDVPVVPGLAFRALRFEAPGIPLDKEELMRQACELGALVADPRYRAEFGLAALGDPALEGDLVDPPVVESINSARRVGPDGRISFNLVAEVLQRRIAKGARAGSSFDFYGGATVILSPQGRVRYVVRKSVTHPQRLAEQRDFINDGGRVHWTELADGHALPVAQPFLALHAFRTGAPRG